MNKSIRKAGSSVVAIAAVGLLAIWSQHAVSDASLAPQAAAAAAAPLDAKILLHHTASFGLDAGLGHAIGVGSCCREPVRLD